MYIVIMAWLYVALMMALAEANHPLGSVLGALTTFVMYGLAPMALAVYLLRTPHRRRAAREKEQAQHQAAPEPSPASSASTAQPDDRGHSAGSAVAAEREEV
ncbi:MAG: hypothetical protein ABI574_13005 [Burkholderiales bacterium]